MKHASLSLRLDLNASHNEFCEEYVLVLLTLSLKREKKKKILILCQIGSDASGMRPVSHLFSINLINIWLLDVGLAFLIPICDVMLPLDVPDLRELKRKTTTYICYIFD